MKKEEITALVQATAAFFATNVTKSYAFRIEQLHKLEAAVDKYEQKINDALYKDLHKVSMETYFTEIGFYAAGM